MLQSCQISTVHFYFFYCVWVKSEFFCFFIWRTSYQFMRNSLSNWLHRILLFSLYCCIFFFFLSFFYLIFISKASFQTYSLFFTLHIVISKTMIFSSKKFDNFWLFFFSWKFHFYFVIIHIFYDHVLFTWFQTTKNSDSLTAI